MNVWGVEQEVLILTAGEPVELDSRNQQAIISMYEYEYCKYVLRFLNLSDTIYLAMDL